VRAWKAGQIYRELGPPVTMIPAMTRALRTLRPDVVHAFSYHDALAARLAGLPYLISYAGIILPRSWQRSPLQFRMFKYASAHAQLIFCPTRACGDALKRDYGFDYELHAYGLDVPAFAPKVDTIPGRIMCAATANDTRKRVDFLVQAFALVAQRNAEAHLVLCAAANDEVQARLRGLLPAEHQDRLIFKGDIPRDELLDEYARASVSALSSLNEAFGLVIIESLAAGTPVVAARSGSVPELLDSTVGGAFDPENVADCAAQLERFLGGTSPELQARCIERAMRYDWDVVGPGTVALYERAARRR